MITGRHFTYLTSIFIFTVFFFNACNDNIDLNTKKVFRYNEHRNVTSLDPAFARNPQNIWPINQLFNGLVQLDNDLNIKPELATSWKISPDGLTYIFHLRKDVYFHESPVFGKKRTRNVKASDFVYSFNRLSDPKVASPGSWVLQQVKEHKALDEFSLLIKLKKNFSSISRSIEHALLCFSAKRSY